MTSNLLITAGPSYEPIDEVRRITNMSTGTLGCLLANRLHAAGFKITLLLANSSSYRGPIECPNVQSFNTADDLSGLLTALAGEKKWLGVLHAAALSDFRVQSVLDAQNQPLTDKKIPSTFPEIRITLIPAPKIIRQLRRLFPESKISGWKYEPAGTKNQVLQKGWQQIAACHSDACIVNGPGYGDGYGFCTAPNHHLPLADVDALADRFKTWLKES